MTSAPQEQVSFEGHLCLNCGKESRSATGNDTIWIMDLVYLVHNAVNKEKSGGS